MYTIFKHRFAHESLREIIKHYKIKKMHIPFYLCDSVRHTLFEEGCKPIFYHVNDDFLPARNFSLEDYILYPNYFGVCSKNVQELAKTYPKLIADNAHAFFDKQIGLAGFNSAYKFGLGDFSYLWLKKETGENLGKSIDMCIYNSEKEVRKKKFQELYNKYAPTNLLKIDKESIPFCYPFLAESTEKADELVKELEKQGLTIYRY
jgi:hypothetical protein